MIAKSSKIETKNIQRISKFETKSRWKHFEHLSPLDRGSTGIENEICDAQSNYLWGREKKKERKNFLNDGNFSVSRIMAFPILFAPSFIANTTRCIFFFFWSSRIPRPTLTRTTSNVETSGASDEPSSVNYTSRSSFSTINFVQRLRCSNERFQLRFFPINQPHISNSNR